MSILTESTVLKRSRADSLQGVRSLNCWGCNLCNVSILHKLPNLEVLNLSCNNLATLDALQSCPNLSELYLRCNQLSDFSVLQPLAHLKSLKVLWLSGNPLSSEPQYRRRVVQVLPQLTQLDDALVTEEERMESNSEDGQQEGGHSSKSNICQAVLCLLPELDQDSLREVQCKIGELLRE